MRIINVTLSVAAAAVVFLSGCGNEDDGSDSDFVATNNTNGTSNATLMTALTTRQTTLAATPTTALLAKKCDVATMDLSKPSPECTAPVLATKRQTVEPNSYIPSVYSRHVSTPATKNVIDLELGNYSGNGKILVYGASKWLVEMANGKFFNSGGHTSEFLLPLYHFARAGFDKFDFVTRDGGAVTLEEWTYPLAVGFENKLRETALKYKEGLSKPKRTVDIPKDLSGYVGILIPGGHGPLVEEHLDVDLGVLLRKAHALDLPIMSLCHGPTALRSAALGGEFPFKGYKLKMFPDAADAWAASGVGYLPGKLKPNDEAERQLRELGMNITNTGMDDSVHQDRELITGASNLAAQKFSELALKALLAKNPTCDVAKMDLSKPSPECAVPVLATKRVADEPNSYIPSVYSRHISTPATKNVTDLELGNYSGNGKILVYGASKWLVEMANGKFFNSGGHTSEFLLPMYHFARAGFDKFDFVTRDGGAVTLEEWTYPLAVGFENKLRETALKYKQGMSKPKRTADIPKDLSGYVGILIPGGHGPLVEEHLDVDLGALLRKAHALDLPIMSLCHGPTALRSAALGGEFPFKGYKLKMFPDAADAWAASGVGYLPGKLKPNDEAERQLRELGMNITNTGMDDSVHQDRELITGASNLAAQKFSELALKALLAKNPR